ncbi:cobyrinate a,c-diamide synthase [Nakamurella sp. YIM 132087]|uniref:Hydrogenobyrinate a,c-diamide synthase n=1 Tax=Nakamurella alba TaxID=2665158 RepID=A0A7K1FG35_9ACTN|nr:cobyrinate a,c-diamide synthase [Nakamurella alba]MTD13067.1 cobyrinate a,c-diamide synthase [Nakamurella alba]
MRLPRIVVAAPASGHGKTTVATGLMAALRRAGHRVSGHKIGPDYIDPGYHRLATGRPGRNLDPHLVGEDLLVPLLLHGAATPEPADVAVVEGVMGLHDGAIGGEGFASTAHVARVLDAPVLLVVDISAASRTVGAVVHGLATFEPGVRIAGVVLNKAGSERHVAEVRAAVARTGIPVLGVLGRDDGIVAPARHLGLVPVDERTDAAAATALLAQRIAAGVDLDAVLRIARSAPDLAGPAWDPATALGTAPVIGHRPVVAVAGGRAFTFRYTETDELLRAAGLEPVVFDPLADDLPDGAQGLYLGGGFPEVHARELAARADLTAGLRAAVGAGLPTVAECAGMLYLCRTLDGAPMVGALPADAVMTPRLTLRYSTAVTAADGVHGPAGGRSTGHEFHRTVVTPAAGVTPAWRFADRVEGFAIDPAGTGLATVHASYLHTHWAGNPSMAAGVAESVRAAAPVRRPARRPAPVRTTVAEPDLHHHGDADAAPGLLDLAVNVRGPAPDWLQDVLRGALDDLAAYPRTDEATAAIAARHGRDPAQVLPTAGGAEAFTLLARTLAPRHTVVVHPQFTEPEAALRAAGHRVDRVLLRPEDGFRLHPAAVPATADLVMIGNPTNPTGALHPRAVLEQLITPGRLLVVDEAFLDAVPGEPESLSGQDLPGVVVVRSLTKTWGIAGLRAGYLLGPAELVARLRAQQPPWSVSSPAAAAMVACCTPRALAEADAMAEQAQEWRADLAARLAALGLPVAGTPRAPFVLLDTGRPAAHDRPDRVREMLRDNGIAVRRGDTFPGLGPGWIRVAVRAPEVMVPFLDALARIVREGRKAG